MDTNKKFGILDNLRYIRKFDKSDMMGLLSDFPNQLRNALALAKKTDLKINEAISNIVFTGLGGSAIGGDFIKNSISDELKIPFIVNRDYTLPGFVDSRTLLFASSYSGNTEETISAYKYAKSRKTRIIVITSGGELESLAKEDGYPVINIPGGMPPRCALGYSFVPALVALSKVGLIEDKKNSVKEAADIVSDLRDASLGPIVPLKKNIAKGIASVLFGRFCAVYGGSKILDCAVTRWRNQLGENSKALATSHYLPEMDHNEIMGFSHPKKLLKDTVVIFLRDKGDHPRIKRRIKLTSLIIKGGIHKIVEVNSKGNSLISRICSLIYIGDFVSFYLAILNK